MNALSALDEFLDGKRIDYKSYGVINTRSSSLNKYFHFSLRPRIENVDILDPPPTCKYFHVMSSVWISTRANLEKFVQTYHGLYHPFQT